MSTRRRAAAAAGTAAVGGVGLAVYAGQYPTAQIYGETIHRERRAGRRIALTYDDFLDAVARLHKVNFPTEREPEQAWPEFIGWRVNYEQAAYAIAEAIDAVPALWSGPRRWAYTPIPPIRPAAGKPPKEHPAKKGHGARRASAAAADRRAAGGHGEHS